MEWKIFSMGMEENCQHGIWKNRLPFHSIPCPECNMAASQHHFLLTQKNV